MRHIKYWAVITVLVILAIWFVSYLFMSFIAWEMLNPIIWLIELPNVDTKVRTGYACSIVGIMFLTSYFTFSMLDLPSKKEETVSYPSTSYVHHESDRLDAVEWHSSG